MEPDTERLGEEREMLIKHYPNFALNMQTRKCTGQIFSHVPSAVYEVAIELPEDYPEKPPSVNIHFPQNPITDYFVDKEFHSSSLTSIAQWNSKQHLTDVIKELGNYIRKKKEEPIVRLLKERDTLSKKKPNFGFTKDFKKCRGRIFSRKIMSATYDVEISISSQFPKEPPEIKILSPKDLLLAHWVNLTVTTSDIPTCATWKKTSEIAALLEELEEVVYLRENQAGRIMEERGILKQNPAFGFSPDGTTCRGEIFSVLSQRKYQVSLALSRDFPAHPPNVVVIPPDDPLIKAYVNTQFNPTELKSVSQWNLQTHIIDIVAELQNLIRSREEVLLKRMIDEGEIVRKQCPNFGFTSDMKECQGIVYVPPREYRVTVSLKNFPQSTPTVRAQGPILANQQLSLPVLRNWNPSITIDAVLKAVEKEIRRIDIRHTLVNKELIDLRAFWHSLEFLPGDSQRAQGSATVALPSGNCNITLDIIFPDDYPETPPAVNLNATGFKSNEIKGIETSLRRKLSSSWSQCKRISEILKQLPEDVLVCLIGKDEITGADFKEEIRRKLPIYYCKKCTNTPSKRICYFHQTSLDRIVQSGGKCIIYHDLRLNESDFGSLQPP